MRSSLSQTPNAAQMRTNQVYHQIQKWLSRYNDPEEQ